MILVHDIDLFSSCECHILPIIGRAHVAYIPDGKVIGLRYLAHPILSVSTGLKI
jgi:GTP cyclohydrolase IA